MDEKQSILIIGKPGSAKTTFLAQFVTITRKAKSSVKFWKTPENIQPIEAAIKNLRAGKETVTTSADDNLVITLPVTIKGKNIEMVCPDYGGEQINAILNLREIKSYWSDLISNSNSWIIFIRPQKLETTFDLSNKTYSENAEMEEEKVVREFKVSDQSSIIELIQIMLSIKKVGYQKPITSPKLTIALTCWDEVQEQVTPESFLEKSLPLLKQFLRKNWAQGKLQVMGVSAQGFALNIQENKDKYLDDGPDKFAYVVKGNSTEQVKDLTLLIEEAV
jgi:Double-GTPase 1